jgi:hypothetical protein
MTIAQLETRVATLEQKLVSLAEKVDAPPSQDVNAWIDQIHGTFQNDSTYRQAARLGRQWRQSHRKPIAGRPRKASGKCSSSSAISRRCPTFAWKTGRSRDRLDEVVNAVG